MAFKSNTATFGTYVGLNSIDGVQVRIGDEFIPPSKVTLPMKLENSFHCHNPSEVLFMEYDFSLEENVIKSSEAYKEAKQAQNCVETEKVGTDVETFMQQQGQDETNSAEAGTAASDMKEANSENDCSNGVPNGDLTASAAENEDQPSKPDDKPLDTVKPVAPGLGSEILVPMQVPTTKPQESATSDQKSESINLADFEREKEQDPFDNAELRVLNDLEELNKVLQNAGPPVASSRSVVDGSSSNSIAVTSEVMDRVVTVTACHTTAMTASVPGSATVVTSGVCIEMPPAAGGGEHSVQNVAGVAYYNKSSDTTAVSFSSQAITACPPTIPPRHNYQPSVKDIQYPELESPSVIPNNSLEKQVTNNPFAYAVPKSFVLPPITNLHGTSTSASCSLSTTAGKNGISGALGPINTGHYAPGVIDHTAYPFHLLSHGAAYSNAQDMFTSGSDGMTSGRLRPTSSTPDIRALINKTQVHHATSRTPPPSFKPDGAQDEISTWKKSGFIDSLHGDTRSCTPPPAYEENHSSASSSVLSKQMTSREHNHKHHGLSKITSDRDTAGGSTSNLPDPYPNMSGEAKSLADTISTMGFPRARVARAIQKHGNDDKLVIDHLCLIGRLSEKYPSDEVEMALDLYGNDEKKAKKYLTLVTQFSELGFSAENVKEALSKSKLDENKTLDILTDNT